MSEDGYFVVDRIHRDDLKAAGFKEEEVDKLTDSEMKWIASKMSSDYHNQLFWSSLKYFTARAITTKVDEGAESG